MKLERSFFASVGNGLLGDVDTIEELTLILGTDLAALGDLGAHEGNQSVIDTLKDEFILDGLGKLDGGSTLHVDLLDVSTTKEVLDLNGVVLGSDLSVNGEMSVDESHLVDEGLNSTLLLINLPGEKKNTPNSNETRSWIEGLTSWTPVNMFLIRERRVRTEQAPL